MNFRKFGSTDLSVSEIGFGAWAIGGGATIGTTAIGWGDADDTISKKAIHKSLDKGINFFDTADIYGLGHSEELIGKIIGDKKEVIVATKVGNVARDEKFTVDYSREYILNACEASLRRLKRNMIDYYQLHTARLAHLQNGACIEAMQQLQREGKIRYWGLSLNTFDPQPEADYLLENNLGTGFQLVLNLINQKTLPVLKDAAAKGYGIIARMPLQFGLLTGKFDLPSVALAKDGKTLFAENDHRKNRLTKEIIDATLKETEPVWRLCKKYNCTKTQLALSYILSYPEVSVIIPGIRTPEHVQLNTEGLFLLEPADRAFIENLGSSSFVSLMEMIQKQE
jgi:aryl-alcohol dehydrogenase-like predicted oxidoreductase